MTKARRSIHHRLQVADTLLGYAVDLSGRGEATQAELRNAVGAVLLELEAAQHRINIDLPSLLTASRLAVRPPRSWTTHYRLPSTYTTACGSGKTSPSPIGYSTDPHETTCKRCRRTGAFKLAYALRIGSR